MFLILRVFNSIFFVIANFSITLYTLHRFFRAMKSHYELIDEVEEFCNLVNQSRASLEYVGSQIMESIREMDSDIGKEVYVTHNLTALSAKIAQVSKRFNELEEAIIEVKRFNKLEEAVIELARLSGNVENASVETPLDINEEVRRILKRKAAAGNPGESKPPHSPRSPRKLKTSHQRAPIESVQSQPTSAFSSKTNSKIIKRRRTPRSSSPSIIPEVMLLDEQLSVSHFEKPIGFRPPWMCQV